MSKNVRFPIAILYRRAPGARLNLFLIALSAALGGSPGFADQDYPPGLFENSPVVPSGPQYAAPPSDQPDPSGPPGPAASGAPNAVAPPDDYCAGVASGTFGSLEEVRRAHALCDRVRRAPPPGY